MRNLACSNYKNNLCNKLFVLYAWLQTVINLSCVYLCTLVTIQLRRRVHLFWPIYTVFVSSIKYILTKLCTRTKVCSNCLNKCNVLCMFGPFLIYLCIVLWSAFKITLFNVWFLQGMLADTEISPVALGSRSPRTVGWIWRLVAQKRLNH